MDRDSSLARFGPRIHRQALAAPALWSDGTPLHCRGVFAIMPPPMAQISNEMVRQVLENVYRRESRRVLAALIRLLGDFDLAEDAMHDAFRIAAVRAHLSDGRPCSFGRSGSRAVG